MQRILIIDNYDSFTYNLVSTLEERGFGRPDVLRNDAFELEDLAVYTHLILSPGPGLPEEAGLLKAVIERYAAEKKILGICLGMQAIGEVFGAKLRNLEKVYHGIATDVVHAPPPGTTSDPLFEEVPTSFTAGRYHSWVVDREKFPDVLQVTCHDEKGEIMGLSHTQYAVYGVQFHPESVMTEYGPQILNNFLNC